jgi:uncharacterized protein YbbK (DUF523 family)/uncharacterized protein YbgA (DUF1722 family)
MVGNRLRIGVSSCLTGQKVRYDGETRPHDFITGTLAAVCELVPVCPEVGIGMGVPRPPIALRGAQGAVTAVGIDNPDLNVTGALQDYARISARDLPAIAGYLFKSRSPSCGLGSVDVTLDSGEVLEEGDGIYAQGIVQAMPLLPVAEETCLDNPECRDHFFERVFIYQRWLMLVQQSYTVESLTDFHHCHEYTVRARSDEAWASLNAIMQESKHTLPEVMEHYISGLMSRVKTPVTRRGHVNIQKLVASRLVNVPEHSLKKLVTAIDDYACGNASRSVPANIIQRLLTSRPQDKLQKQVYLYPTAQETELRIWT